MSNFEGKICVVTGGSSGIGRAAVENFAQGGATVYVLDVARAETNSSGDGDPLGIFIQTNVADEASVVTAIGQIHREHGRLDIAVNNAGVKGTQTPLHTVDRADWDRIISINLGGIFNCMKAELEVMTGQGHGTIVNTSSTLGLVGNIGAAVYSASKHGVLGLTKCAALEYGKQGIRVNAVAPGLIETAMASQLTADPDKAAQIMARQTMGRVGQPEEVAAAIAFLASDSSSFINGACLAADGGLTAI